MGEVWRSHVLQAQAGNITGFYNKDPALSLFATSLMRKTVNDGPGPLPTRPTLSSAAVLPSASSPPSAQQPIIPPDYNKSEYLLIHPVIPIALPLQPHHPSLPSSFRPLLHTTFSPSSHLHLTDFLVLAPAPSLRLHLHLPPPPASCRSPVLSVYYQLRYRARRVLFQRRNLDQTPILLYISCVLLAEFYPTY